MQAAEAGCVACYTEIPTDDVALQVPCWQCDPKSCESSKFGHLSHLAGLVRGGGIRTTTDKGSKLSIESGTI